MKHSISIRAVALAIVAILIFMWTAFGNQLSAAADLIQPVTYPTPAKILQYRGYKKLVPQSRIMSDEYSRENAGLLQKELKAVGLSLEVESIEGGSIRPEDICLTQNIYQATDGLNNVPNLKKNGYHISVFDQEIRINGPDAEGQLYGILSFLQLIDVTDLTLPLIDIVDWPTLSFRGLRGHFPKNDAHEVEQFKRIIRAMAFCRLNQLWIRDLYVRRFPASIRLDTHPEISDGDAISKSLARELIQYARQHHVLVMGSISSTSDIVWSIYPDLIEMGSGESPATVPIKNEKRRTSKYRYGARFNFCPSTEQTYRLLFDLVDELAPLFTSEVFDLGIDEVSQYQNGSRWVADSRCRGKDPVRLFAEYTNRLADYVTAKGKIPLVNSTPFIKEHGGAFHDLYQSVDLIPKNIVINNWSEGFVRQKRRKSLFANIFGDTDFSSTEYFASHGLYTIIHMVGAGKRWKDRPELLEQIEAQDCYGAFITHYTYMTAGKLSSAIINGMSFSGNHFWSTNKPAINSKEDKALTRYARLVVDNILKGKSYLKAIEDARSRLVQQPHK